MPEAPLYFGFILAVWMIFFLGWLNSRFSGETTAGKAARSP